jgi:hypothetical protein
MILVRSMTGLSSASRNALAAKEVYLPAEQGFAGAPEEIEKKFIPHTKTVCSTVM